LPAAVLHSAADVAAALLRLNSRVASASFLRFAVDCSCKLATLRPICNKQGVRKSKNRVLGVQL
jgi:hypothetical protein